MTSSQHHQYVVCINDGGDELDLIRGKLYRVLEPEPNDGPDEVRIIDQSGEDYLYPRDWFVAVELPQAAIEALEAA